MKHLSISILAAALASALPIAAHAQEEVSAAGPQGALAGTLIRPAKGQPLVLIVPGSGPTDRDGNNSMGITASPYRMLAEALAERGIGSLRIDKRGLFGSKGAVADPNAVTLSAYGDDVAAWIAEAREETGVSCVWLLGHSEGGLIAVTAAPRLKDVCGVILVAAPGRPLGDVIRAQFKANPANAPILDQALGAIDRLERGETVDVTGLHPALQGIFAPRVQGYLIDMMARDPARLAAEIALPMLIVQGGKDLQVTRADGDALHAAQPGAQYVVVPQMNHVLKNIAEEGSQANMAAYADPSLPIAPELVDAVAGFVTEGQGGAR